VATAGEPECRILDTMLIMTALLQYKQAQTRSDGAARRKSTFARSFGLLINVHFSATFLAKIFFRRY
jgi:hypothetical protein